MMEILKEFWGQILAFVAVLVWAVRIESSTKTNKSEIERLWKQRAEDLAAHKEAREATNEMLAEVRSDIKELLRKVGA